MTACAIHFDTSKELLQSMEVMFSKGFVFTEDRITDIKSVKRNYPGSYLSWRYIFVGHHYTGKVEDRCKMMMNTSARTAFWKANDDTPCQEMTMETFLTNILPDW